MVTKEILEYLKETLDGWDLSILPKERGPYTAALADESDENGLVEFKDCSGVVMLTMLRKDYDSIMEYNINDN